jgi:membrane-associated phospholipid phosphatase
MPAATLVLLLGLAVQPAVDEVDVAPVLASSGAVQAPDPAQNPPQQAPKPAGSDVPADQKEPPTPPHTGIRALLSGVVEDVRHLPSKQNGYLALLGGGLALGAHQVDGSFNVRLRSHYATVNTAFAPGKYFGGTPVQVALSVGAYAYGRTTNSPKVSHLGMDLLRAQILTEGLVEGIKYSVRRERPDGSNRLSFPSGHSAITFASATVLERHLGWRQAALAYSIATYVAASRLHDNVHYLSDVAFGAAIGAIAGRTVTQHGREMWTLVPATMPGGGMAIYMVRNN